MHLFLRLLGVIWASPYTVLGLMLGCIGLCTGGRVRIHGRAIEFYGGAVKWLVTRLPHGQFTLAFTLGHTILGQSEASLDIAREHEVIHVRQFERWDHSWDQRISRHLSSCGSRAATPIATIHSSGKHTMQEERTNKV